MDRTIFCTYLQRETAGLDAPPYGGELGTRIYNEISKEAWGAWQRRQTMLVNEHRLRLTNSDDQAFLEQEMIRFLFQGGENRL
ncbi:MAG: oxidative damage protection protein [Streptomyces sp.]